MGFSSGGSPPEPSITQHKGTKRLLPNVELFLRGPHFNHQPVMMESPHVLIWGDSGVRVPLDFSCIR